MISERDRERETYKDKLEKLSDRYWSDSEFRHAKNEENKNRSKVRLICFECNNEFADGSMLAHQQLCRGVREMIVLELLVRLR